MKTSYRKPGPWMMLILLMGLAINLVAGDKTPVDTLNFISYTGVVKDAESGKTLPFATIEASGTHIATVSNIDGEFLIKIGKGVQIPSLKISYIGYKNKEVALTEFDRKLNATIKLQPNSLQLQEVTIRPQEAAELVSKVLYNIKNNYSREPMMMRGFYRETIQRGRSYVSIAEAITDIYKSPYMNEFQVDQVKLFKGRKSSDVQKMDTVLFKMQGGPNTTLMMDIMKNPSILLTDEFYNIYDFELKDVISIDDRLHYVIAFKQKDYIDDPLYSGRFYIEIDKLAISEAEFELNVSNKEEAARLFIQKKPIGMSVTPERAFYRAKYTIADDKWYFSYARGEVKFKVNWKKKLFNTTFTSMSEMVITDRSSEGIEKFTSKERFKKQDVLNEKVFIFFDQGFWEGYNVIEPDQSIESAIKKLNRKYLKRGGDV